MKKIFIGLAVIALASCTSYPYIKGNYTLGARNTFNDYFYTYAIEYYDSDPFSDVEAEIVVSNDYDIGAVSHTVPGGIVASSKTTTKEIYSDEIVRPSKKGAMVSYAVPVEFSDEKVYKVIGESEIEGKKYRLLEPNSIGDIVLLDMKGNIYPRIGRIYNDRLALLNTSFILEPSDLVFNNEVINRVGNASIVSGYEIRYQGLQDYMMVFDYVVTSGNDEKSKQEKTYKFPMYDKSVTIGGYVIEILDVNAGGIEYRIVQ